MNRKIFVVFGAVALSISVLIVSFLFFTQSKNQNLISPLGQIKINPFEKSLDKYSYEALKNQVSEPSEISIEKLLEDEKDFMSYLFYFTVHEKKVSGVINIPQKSGTLPVVLMLRGFINQEVYKSGDGSRHFSEYLAEKGYITIAPDFLGYGSSDKESEDHLEARFQTYTTTLSVLSALPNLNRSFLNKGINDMKADLDKIGIWGHSNGGQIALTILEITGNTYPTVLWAPVSKPFPYSVLYYVDDMTDRGKLLQTIISDFEKDYDPEKYSLTSYLPWIKAPLQIHQGGVDDSIPQDWSDTLVENLKKENISVQYFTYPHEDHNFLYGNWPLVASRSYSFYKNQFETSDSSINTSSLD